MPAAKVMSEIPHPTKFVIDPFLYFGTRRNKWNRYANLVTYYTGIYLISVSAYWI